MKTTFNVLRVLLLIFAFALDIACGVKADPQPPLTPAEIGRGKPLYREEEEDTTPLQRRVLPEDEQKNDQDSDESQ